MARPKADLHAGNLKYSHKAAIVRYKKTHPDASYKRIAEWAQIQFNLHKTPSESTISRTLQEQDRFVNLSTQDESIRRQRVIPFTQLEEALKMWVLQMQHQRIALSVAIIQEKGKQFAKSLGISLESELQCSEGWVKRFCQRNGFRQFRLHGESGSAQMEGIEETLAVIKEKLAKYELHDIYNMDETGLFYSMAPDKTIAQRQIEDSKNDKTRITVAFTCNVDGSDQFEPLFIGHAGKPRCFLKKTALELGFKFYYHNKKAWMTGIFFQDYLKRFNRHVNRKVALVIDNAPSHVIEGLDSESEFSNIEIIPLPPNTTSKLQPLDAGIIAAFKKHYQRRQLAHALDLMDAGSVANPYKVSQLQAMRWSVHAWNGLDQSVFANCWKHTGLL